MPAPFFLAQSSTLKHRLLGSASAAAIMLAMSIAAPTDAVAQATILAAGDDGTVYHQNVGADLTDIQAGFHAVNVASPVVVTIDLHNSDVTMPGIIADDSILTVNIIDSVGGGNGPTLEISSFAGQLAAVTTGVRGVGRPGILAINVGEGSANPLTLLMSGNAWQYNPGTINYMFGSTTGSVVTNGVFDNTPAAGNDHQHIAASIGVQGDDDTVAISVINSGGGGSGYTWFARSITLGTGDTFTVGGASSVATTTAQVNGDLVAPGGIFVDSSDAAATLHLGYTDGFDSFGQQLGFTPVTITGDMDSLSSANAANLIIGDGVNARQFTLGGDINSTATWSSIQVRREATFRVRGSIADDAPVTVEPAGILELGTPNDTFAVSTVDSTISNTGTIQIAEGSAVTINAAVTGSGKFASTGANTVLTINTVDATSVTQGSISLDQGMLILGTNIGDGDTIFAGDLSHGGTAPTLVQVSENFQEGIIVLVNSDTDESANVANFNVVDTDLVDYVIRSRQGDASVIELFAQLSAIQNPGIAVSQFAALEQALAAAIVIGDTTIIMAIRDAIAVGTQSESALAGQISVQQSSVGAGARVGFQVAGDQQQIAGNRLTGRRGATDARFASAFSETGFAGGDPITSTLSPNEPRYAGSIWMQAYGGVAEAEGNSIAAGYDASFGGAMIGIDGAISDTVAIGVFGGYSLADVDGDGSGNAQLETSSYSAGVYGSYTGENFYLDAFGSFTYGENETARTLTLVGTNRYAGSYDSEQISLAISGGVPVELAPSVFITPNASLTWSHYEADGYTEVGPAPLANTVSAVSATQLTGTIGTRIHAVYENFDGVGTTFVPEARLGVSYDLVDQAAAATASFSGGGVAYQVTGTDISNVGALVGLGLSLNNAGWSAGISYDADIRSDFMSHTARAEFRWSF